jgi:hypothetical protein
MKFVLLLLAISTAFAQESFFSDAPIAEAEAASFFADTPVESADEAVMTYDLDERKVDIKEKPWHFDISVSALQYRPNFEFRAQGSQTAKFGSNFTQDTVDSFGTTLEIGRDYYFSDRLSGTTTISSYFSMLDKTENTRADPSIDVDIYSQRADTKNYGVGVNQAFGYDYKYENVIIRPFIEYSVGYARADTRLDYQYDLGDQNTGNVQTESYALQLDDSYVYNSLSLGVRFVLESGMASYIKISRNGVLNGKLRLRGSKKPDPTSGSPIEPVIEDDFDSNTGIATYGLQIGMGYYF